MEDGVREEKSFGGSCSKLICILKKRKKKGFVLILLIFFLVNSERRSKLIFCLFQVVNLDQFPLTKFLKFFGKCSVASVYTLGCIEVLKRQVTSKPL